MPRKTTPFTLENPPTTGNFDLLKVTVENPEMPRIDTVLYRIHCKRCGNEMIVTHRTLLPRVSHDYQSCVKCCLKTGAATKNQGFSPEAKLARRRAKYKRDMGRKQTIGRAEKDNTRRVTNRGFGRQSDRDFESYEIKQINWPAPSWAIGTRYVR